jgi:hypothetical protein
LYFGCDILAFLADFRTFSNKKATKEIETCQKPFLFSIHAGTFIPTLKNLSGNPILDFKGLPTLQFLASLYLDKTFPLAVNWLWKTISVRIRGNLVSVK